jgi:type VI secretion system FHA domain protein
MIVLSVKSFNGAASDALVASFDELGGTIGRADNNQLVLPDPDRAISRIHAQVVFRNGSYAIVDRGSNPVLLNGQALGNGRELPINDGDELQIGGYLIGVSFGHKTTTHDPFADLFGGGNDALFGAAPAAPKAVPRTAPAQPTPRAPVSSPPAASPFTAPGASAIPDDWNPFAPDAAPASDALGIAAPPGGADANPYIPDLPLSGPSQQDSLDALFGLGAGTAGADPLSRSPMSAPALQPNTSADADPLRAFGIPPGPKDAQVSDHASELSTPWTAAPLEASDATSVRPAAARPAAPAGLPAGAVLSWDQPSRESKPVGAAAPIAAERTPAPAAPFAATASPHAAATPRPNPVRQPAAEASAPDALLSALREGLGAPDLRLETLDEPTMRLLGQLLREATRGTVELLIARAALKREMRAEVTMIVARENNPLKFSPTADAALQHLLGPRTPGFMAPGDAMRDAFDDLRAHQLGVMAGMRSALEGVLKRFDPAVLEGRLTKRSALSGLLPGSRKAQLWELFQTLYAQLSEEAAEDFHELFGKAFLRAYESHIELLQRDE